MNIHNNIKLLLVATVFLMSSFAVHATKRSCEDDDTEAPSKSLKFSDQSGICPICHDDFADYDDPPESLTCGHKFCVACIGRALQEKLECAICRKKVDLAYVSMMCVSEEGKAIIRKNYATRVEATCEFQMTQMLLGLTAGRQVGHSQHLGRHADLARAGIHDFRSVVVSSDNKYSGAQFIEAAITAAIEGDFKLVKRFVKGGVSPHARNKEGLTLLEAARDNAQSDIVDYLLSVIQERAQVSGS